MVQELINDELTQLNIPTILTKRKGDKLLVANKGCCTLIGVIYPYRKSYIIEGRDSIFPSEDRALEALLMMICRNYD